ncbi:hypothetical protein AMAG_19792 [Allomyces macrogynus ATCC 38327]|uniref:Hsp70-like protein n=1 Tax=Allomyces macrogynus (strain ATCC 38327) TaxID=578462 RepID=A0A0L0T158_ALLM3|nr:hypothetical protein AMAG_19792 [Allomyces macrogynus ATCC 38327]|eukprot:KNE68334.1 hypothetical protein AMAG_19792 [Allomyces macrogynus ATCC 38327]
MTHEFAHPDEADGVHPIRHQVVFDFGTSHSGFARATRDFPDSLTDKLSAGAGSSSSPLKKLNIDYYIKYKTSWPGGQEPYAKTRTALLYDLQGRLVAWGNEAHHKYLMMHRGKQKNHIYIDRFKLFLDDSRKHEDPAMNQLKTLGKDIDDVIADFLGPLASQVGEYCQFLDTEDWNPYEVRWCLTVPAMWSDAAKAKMRQAMQKAGLIRSAKTTTRLEFCSEPLAGLLFETFSAQSRSVIKADDPVVVVDMGGGTVDLTVMCGSGSGFKELVQGLGASCGSTMLDSAFLKMFRDVIGSKDYDNVIKKSPQLENKLRNQWERRKKAFTGAESEFRVAIQVPSAMYNVCQHDDGVVPGTGGAELEDGELYLSRDTMVMLYEPIVDQIHGLVLSMLNACQSKGINVAHILCVGGFSQSKYLVGELRHRLMEKDAAKIVVSLNGGAAVLLGAPIYACRPELLLKQVARVSYGAQVSVPYRPERHGLRESLGDRLFQAPDGLRVKGVFSPVIRKGQALTPGIVATKKYRAESFTDTIIRASWFVSKLESPIFTDTSDCKCIGVLEVQVTPSQDYANRDTVEVTISMSPSGLMFHAKSLSTNKPVDCRIEFHD